MKDQIKVSVLKKFQQSELNACVMYQELADVMKNTDDRNLMLKFAADEGRHAGILKNITNEVLTPTDKLKRLIIVMYKIMGKKALFQILSVSEAAAAKGYRPFFGSFRQVQEIASDELNHSRLLKEYAAFI